MYRSVLYTLCLILCFNGISCSSSNGGGTEVKPPVSQDQQVLVKKTLMSVTTYDVRVNTDTPVLQKLRTAIQKLLKKDSPMVNACSGEATMSIYSDFSQKMEGKLSCFGTEFNLADTLAAPEVERVEEDMSQYAYFGQIMRENNPPITDNKIPVGTAYFRPPKPLMINPVIDPATIPTPITEESSVVVSNSTGIQTKSTGTFTIQIINPKVDIPADIDSSYIKGDMVHIDIKSAGFSDISNKAQYLLFPSRQMYISLNPIIISKMIITAPMSDLLSSSDSKISNSFLKTLVDDLTVTFAMKKHEIK